jgi:hypothetical protein
VDRFEGQRFNTNEEEFLEAVEMWWRTQPKEFFTAGFLKSFERWTECFAKEGRCIREK